MRRLLGERILQNLCSHVALAHMNPRMLHLAAIVMATDARDAQRVAWPPSTLGQSCCTWQSCLDIYCRAEMAATHCTMLASGQRTRFLSCKPPFWQAEPTLAGWTK